MREFQMNLYLLIHPYWVTTGKDALLIEGHRLARLPPPVIRRVLHAQLPVESVKSPPILD